MAPERPRSVEYDIPFGPRIIERKPEGEVQELYRSARPVRPQHRPILRHPEPERIEADYVELREPGRRRPPPINIRRQVADDFVPLPRPVPSPRYPLDEETPTLEIRTPRQRPIIHTSPSPLREHRRRRASSPSPSPSPVREVERIRICKLDKSDSGKAERYRGRAAEDEIRVERERRRHVEENNRHLAERASREASERRRAQRDAQNAIAQRRSAEIAAAELQQQNERLDRARRLAEREAAILERERLRERDRLREQERVREVSGRPQGAFRLAREPLRSPRDPIHLTTDRGAQVIQAAQANQRLRHRERNSYHDYHD
ncbi:hypothetical protein EPUS_03316 [Endocarpon pusillum Z07020]|uniref:Uncharacterized protein n=1 Tax=Endocarpon pusillum (strain Z07020 / HMAS-L-300199) TaxID=1263415 RepID=U1GGX4_ENDPU|nr:uncharacterized protein EPUS_03316 [Endocarpon pusillum Z07020]ERF71036.1 hypothetical protein EPUS_03316 [Endocarpon pusillum Z07020]